MREGSSKEITIDDIVKFIHDNFNSSFIEFPYTTWDSIPNYEDADDGDICKTNNYGTFGTYILTIPNDNEGQSYVIGQKGQLVH